MKSNYALINRLLVAIVIIVCIASTICYTVIRPLKPKYNGKSIEQWLDILRANHASREDALRIISVVYDDTNKVIKFEVPLDYDLLMECEIIGCRGCLGVWISNSGYPCTYERSIAGTCILNWHISDNYLNVQSQTIKVSAYLSLADSRIVSNALFAVGPKTNITVNRITIQ